MRTIGAEIVSLEHGKIEIRLPFNPNLLAPAKGESFVARAAVKRSGRTLIICTADAFAIQGGGEKLVATMLATMMNIPDRSNS